MHESYSAFGLTIYSPEAESIKALQKQHPTSLHGDRLWDASFLLMSYLEENPLPIGSKILDLGCGWGLLSLYLMQKGHYHIIALDADSHVFPYLQAHAQLNQLTMPNTLVADFSTLQEEDLAAYDVILAADVCFWDTMAAMQESLIDKAVAAGVKTILYSDPMRPPFHHLVDYCCEQHFADAFEYEINLPQLKAVNHSSKVRGAIMCIENQ